jgi:hypothetical protein
MSFGKLKPIVSRARRSLLLKMYAAVVTIGLSFHYVDEGFKSALDPYILLSIGALFLVSVVAMLFLTEEWTTRVLGVFTSVQGNSVVYIAASLAGLGLIPLALWSVAIDFGRAFFLVGGPILAYSWYKYFRDKLNEKKLNESIGVT